VTKRKNKNEEEEENQEENRKRRKKEKDREGEREEEKFLFSLPVMNYTTYCTLNSNSKVQRFWTEARGGGWKLVSCCMHAGHLHTALLKSYIVFCNFILLLNVQNAFNQFCGLHTALQYNIYMNINSHFNNQT
jgi:hypothetical protein